MKPPPACGTPGGFHRHHRRNEKPCRPCLAAFRRVQNARNRALSRLARLHPGEYVRLLAEETEKAQEEG